VMTPRVLAALAVLAVAADTVTTYLVLAAHRGYEGNAVVAGAIARFGVSGGLMVSALVRTLAVGAAALVLVLYGRRCSLPVRAAGVGLLFVAAVFWMGAAVNNAGYLA